MASLRRRTMALGTGALTAASIGLFLRPLPARAQVALDLATAYPIGNFHVENLKHFADDLAGGTQGRLSLRVHAGGSLVGAAEIAPAVRAGKVAIGELFGPSMAPSHGVFALDAIPFLVTNYEAAHKLLSTAREKMSAVLAAQGLVLLLSVPWPPQGLFSAVPLAFASDLRGLRMRENSAPVKRLAELIEAVPVRVETPELAAAAAERRIDLVFTSAAQALDTRLHEALPYYYEANAWLPRNLVVMHRGTLERLAAADRATLINTARKSEERGWAASAAFARSSAETLARQRGVKRAALTPSVKMRLERLGNQIGAEVLRTRDNELLGLAGLFLR